MNDSVKPCPKILFIAPHRPNRSPSQRFRMEQFFFILDQQRIPYTYAWLLSEKQDKIFYARGYLVRKVFILLYCLLKRIRHLFLLFSHDVVFIQRESFFLNTIFFERIARCMGKKVVFDIDDALWIPDTSEANRFWSFLKNPAKPFRSMKYAHIVLAGNEWLVEKCREVQPDSCYLPTVVDTKQFFPFSRTDRGAIPVLGWTGSHTTFHHLTMLFPVLEELYREKKFLLRISVSSLTQVPQVNFPVEKVIWTKENEPDVIRSFDVGLMPLPDEEWVLGKCGLKALVCMACGVPVIASKIGVSEKIIEHGMNGWLVNFQSGAWKNTLLQVLDNRESIIRCGQNAFRTVCEKYSLSAWSEKWMELVTGKKTVSEGMH